MQRISLVGRQAVPDEVFWVRVTATLNPLLTPLVPTDSTSPVQRLGCRLNWTPPGPFSVWVKVTVSPGLIGASPKLQVTRVSAELDRLTVCVWVVPTCVPV